MSSEQHVILRPIVGPPASTSAAPPPMLPDAGKEKSHLPLRIDPVTCPAVIEIAEITLKDPGSNKILWSATAREEFTACKILGTAARLPHDKHLRILSFGGDPQLLLPSSTAGLDAKSLRLEISLLVNRGTNTIRDCLATLNGTTPT